jgi:ABC-type hemin transport system ATPase subunit
MLSIEHLSAAYGARVVLQDVSLETHNGEILGLVGPNGAGKSSLLRVISGSLASTRGKVQLNGIELTRLSIAARARQVAVVGQSVHLPEAFTVGEVVLMGRTPHLPLFGGERPHDYEIVHAALTHTATDTLAERRIGELSGGEQQRVLIARALAQITDGAAPDKAPRVLLLDEATAHLDLKHQTAIMGLVRELARSGLIVIAALHDLNLAAQYADRLALLSEGRLLVCGEPAQVLTAEWLRRAYDVSAVVSSHPLYDTPLVALVADERKPHTPRGRVP